MSQILSPFIFDIDSCNSPCLPFPTERAGEGAGGSLPFPGGGAGVVLLLGRTDVSAANRRVARWTEMQKTI